jgi:hypothetical protein
MLYLLHTRWKTEDDTIQVYSLPLNILDFLAIYNYKLPSMMTQSEEVLINTGWLFSNTVLGQSFYSSIAKVANDFDGKIFLVYFPGEGQVVTSEGYEDAIMQLAENDEKIVSEDIKDTAIENLANSLFYEGADFYNKVENLVSLPENVGDVIDSVESADELIKDLFHSNLLDSATKKTKGWDTSSFSITELQSISKSIGTVNDGIKLLQLGWNAYDLSKKLSNWDTDFLEQVQVLANYEDNGLVNSSIVNITNKVAKKLIKSYQAPQDAVLDELVEDAFALLTSEIYEASPFGKIGCLLATAGNVCGILSERYKNVTDVYEKLYTVSFSVKIEQLVWNYILDGNLLYDTKEFSYSKIQDFRNQIMLYLRLNLRNKYNLYQLNLEGNTNKNWKDSDEAKKMINEISECYDMIIELMSTQDYDEWLELQTDFDKAFQEEFHQKISMDTVKEDKNELLSVEDRIKIYLEENEENYPYFSVVDINNDGILELLTTTEDKLYSYNKSESKRAAVAATLFAYVDGKIEKMIYGESRYCNPIYVNDGELVFPQRLQELHVTIEDDDINGYELRYDKFTDIIYKVNLYDLNLVDGYIDQHNLGYVDSEYGGAEMEVYGGEWEFYDYDDEPIVDFIINNKKNRLEYLSK